MSSLLSVLQMLSSKPSEKITLSNTSVLNLLLYEIKFNALTE